MQKSYKKWTKSRFLGYFLLNWGFYVVKITKSAKSGIPKLRGWLSILIQIVFVNVEHSTITVFVFILTSI